MRLQSTNSFPQRVDWFLYSPAFVVWVGFWIVLSNVFSLEMVSYTVILLSGIYVCLFARDFLPLMPIFVLCYFSPSYRNNPGIHTNSVLSSTGGILYLAILLVAFFACAIYRIVKDPVFGGKKFLKKKRKLLSGMLLLGAAYAISGLGSGQWAQYGWRNLLFSVIQLFSIAIVYYLLSGAVRWELAPKGYIFWVGTVMGYVLLAELANIYLTVDIIRRGALDRSKILTGWGHYNNFGAMLAMAIPMPFFLTGKRGSAWFGYLSAFLFVGGLLATCSRGSILVGVPIFVLSYLVSLVNSRNARRQFLMHGLFLAAVGLAVFYYKDALLELFRTFIKLGFKSEERLKTYAEGIKQFLKHPIFGASFFPISHNPGAWANVEGFLYLFPPRWHNTFIQLLATGGCVALLAYIVHRAQTIVLYIRNFSTQKLFTALSILALLGTSMVDCHFFNVGPMFFYSALLVATEYKLDIKK